MITQQEGRNVLALQAIKGNSPINVHYMPPGG